MLNRFVAAALALAASCGIALAQTAPAAPTAPASRLDAIVAAGVLRVGSTGDYRPFTARDPKTGEFSGFDIDLAKSLADAMGVKLVVVPTAWPKMMADFKADKFDIAMGGVSVTYPRQLVGVFSIPYMHEGKTPITACANVAKFATLAEIDKPDVRVITNPGGTNEAFDRAHFKAAKIIVFPDNTKIFDELAAGKADLMITDASETRFQANVHKGVLCSVHPDKPFDFAEKAYWMQRDFALKAFVDQWLHTSMQNGVYQAIFKKYFG
jgi:cyclohexadienyl dehydratase